MGHEWRNSKMLLLRPNPITGSAPSAPKTLGQQLTAQAEEERAHERRVARLEETGWERVGDGWELSTNDPRWSVVGSREIAQGDSFEARTKHAYGIEMRRRAEERKREQQKGRC